MNKDVAAIVISGEISMNSEFINWDLHSASEIQISLGDVNYINSAGIRKWMLWMGLLTKNYPRTKIVFCKVPAVFIRQVNLIRGFIPEKSQVVSFYVPFYCEACDEIAEKVIESSDVMNLKVVKDGKDLGPQLFGSMSCPKCQKEMEFDAVLEQYLDLMKHYGPVRAA